MARGRTTVSTRQFAGQWLLEGRITNAGNNRRLVWQHVLKHAPNTEEGRAEIQRWMERVNKPNSIG